MLKKIIKEGVGDSITGDKVVSASGNADKEVVDYTMGVSGDVDEEPNNPSNDGHDFRC